MTKRKSKAVAGNRRDSLHAVGAHTQPKTIEQRIMDLLAAKGPLTRRQISDELKIHSHSAIRAVMRLKIGGWVEDSVTDEADRVQYGSVVARTVAITDFGREHKSPRGKGCGAKLPFDSEKPSARIRKIRLRLGRIERTIREIRTLLTRNGS